MPTKYPVVLEDDSGVTRIEGELEFTGPSQGGSGIQVGAGSPLGVVVPTALGSLYVDQTNGALYVAITALNTGWVVIGGVAATVEGTQVDGPGPAGSLNLLAPAGGVVNVTDVLGLAGTGNSFSWVANGTDGQQRAALIIGSTGQFVHNWGVEGEYVSPGGIGFFGTDPPNAKPATPILLADVIALLQSYGMCQ
jgi:hypothetical protein